MILQTVRDVDIMMLYIAARDHASKLNFSRYVHLTSINKKFQYRYARVILCSVGEVSMSAIFQLWNMLGC